MKNTDLIKIYDIILRLALLYHSRCLVCQKRCVTGKYFLIHHATKKAYQISKNHKDFDNRLDYYTHLFPIVRENKSEFALLCCACHNGTTKLSRYRKEARKRMYKLANRMDL